MNDDSEIPRGIGIAIPIARLRGHAMIFVPSIYNVGDFVIAGPGWFIIVRVRFTQRIHEEVNEIEKKYSLTIAKLRSSRSVSVSCELWLYSRSEELRHFRVRDAGIEEIDGYGRPLSEMVAPENPENSGPGTGVAGAANPVPAAAPPADPCEIFRRWHKKRNAIRKAAGIRDFHDPHILELMCREENEIAEPAPAGKSPAGDPVTAESGRSPADESSD